jgi:hypothetical protein
MSKSEGESSEVEEEERKNLLPPHDRATDEKRDWRRKILTPIPSLFCLSLFSLPAILSLCKNIYFMSYVIFAVVFVVLEHFS